MFKECKESNGRQLSGSGNAVGIPHHGLICETSLCTTKFIVVMSKNKKLIKKRAREKWKECEYKFGNSASIKHMDIYHALMAHRTVVITPHL